MDPWALHSDGFFFLILKLHNKVRDTIIWSCGARMIFIESALGF